METGPARWLTAGEQRAWRTFLEASQLLVERLDHDLRADGLSHADYEILANLSEAPGGRLRMSDLAGQSLFSRSRLSHAVRRLERAGWVRREACPTDRRGTFAVLTETGRGRLEAAAPGHVASVRRYFFDGLDDEAVAQLERIFGLIRGALRGGEGDREPTD